GGTQGSRAVTRLTNSWSTTTGMSINLHSRYTTPPTQETPMPTNPDRPDLEFEIEAAAGRRTAQRGRPVDFELEVAAGQRAQPQQQWRLEPKPAAGPKAAANQPNPGSQSAPPPASNRQREPTTKA